MLVSLIRSNNSYACVSQLKPLLVPSSDSCNGCIFSWTSSTKCTGLSPNEAKATLSVNGGVGINDSREGTAAAAAAAEAAEAGEAAAAVVVLVLSLVLVANAVGVRMEVVSVAEQE